MRREYQECFPHHRLQKKLLVTDPGMRRASAVMHVGIGNPRWQRKHSRRMRNPQFYVSDKGPIPWQFDNTITADILTSQSRPAVINDLSICFAKSIA